MRQPISAEEYLSVPLRFLATGETFVSLGYQFRISRSTLSIMIPFVCKVIYNGLKPEVLKCPDAKAEWREIAKDFTEKWQLPNCIGAGDGKHIRLLCPKNSGSLYYQYKGYYSIVLMAFVRATYEFLFVDAGAQGSASDGGIFRRTLLWEASERGTLHLPSPSALPKNSDPIFEDTCDEKVEYFFVCDDAFPLGMHIMKPFSKRKLADEQRVFNYRLSRARRVSENAFGIMAVRFPVLHTMICISPERAVDVTLACCALYNMLLVKPECPYARNRLFDNEDQNVNIPSRQHGSCIETANFTGLPKIKE